MVKRIILNSFIWLIIVGCIGYAVALILGDATPTILEYKSIDYGNGITVNMYQLNVANYLQNLDNTLDIPFKDMYIDFPSIYQPKQWDIIATFKMTVNAYVWILNVILWMVNITVVMPTKLLIHPIVLMLSLLGINTTKLGLVDLVNKIYTTTIEYIRYL